MTVLRRNNKIYYDITHARMHTNIIIYSTRTRFYEQWYNDIRTFDAAAAVAVCARLCGTLYTIITYNIKIGTYI